jgi:hypothetical protein
MQAILQTTLVLHLIALAMSIGTTLAYAISQSSFGDFMVKTKSKVC